MLLLSFPLLEPPSLVPAASVKIQCTFSGSRLNVGTDNSHPPTAISGQVALPRFQILLQK